MHKHMGHAMLYTTYSCWSFSSAGLLWCCCLNGSIGMNSIQPPLRLNEATPCLSSLIRTPCTALPPHPGKPLAVNGPMGLRQRVLVLTTWLESLPQTSAGIGALPMHLQAYMGVCSLSDLTTQSFKVRRAPYAKWSASLAHQPASCLYATANPAA